MRSSSLFIFLAVIFLLAPSCIFAQMDGPGSGLIASFPFSEGVGLTTSDISGNNFTGSLINDPTWTSGVVPGNAALSFDGINDYVNVPNFNSINGLSACTISFWVKPLATGRTVMSKWGSAGRLFDIYSSDTRLIAYWRFGGANTGGTSLLHATPKNTFVLNEWQHFAFSYNNGISSFYRNGVFVNAISGGGTLNTGVTEPLRIGFNSARSNLSGILDDVRLYNRALDSTEIAQLRDLGMAPPSPPDTISPSVPTDLVASPISSSQIDLSWGASTDNVAVVGYRIYRDENQIATVNAGAKYSDTGLLSNTSYSYKVRSYDLAGNISEPSLAVVVTTQVEVPKYLLNVTKQGTGNGTIISVPVGISCGTTCSFSYNQGSAVQLTAIPSLNSTFDGWSGEGCSGTDVCQVALNASANVVASFTSTSTESQSAGQAYEWGFANQFPTRAATLKTLNSVVLMSANSDWSLALKSDGTLAAWGSNKFGQLNVPVGKFVHAAAGWEHGIACRTDGTIEEWGNPYGNTEASWEAKRPAITNCVQVAAGDNHSAALLADGTVITWGGRPEVVSKSGMVKDAVQIASGWYAVEVLHKDGTVSVFGTVSNPGEYITPPQGLSNVVKIAASQFSFYAIKGDGTLAAWGVPNTYGQLTPPANATNLVAVAGGRYHTIVARADGTVIVWGDNTDKQLDMPPNLSNVFIVGAGRYYSQAIRASSTTP